MPTTTDSKEAKQLTKALLKGHRGQVNCIAHSSSVAESRPPANSSSRGIKKASPAASPSPQRPEPAPSLLLSGSSDGTARLWDLRMQRAALCIIAPGDDNGDSDVTSVTFHPQSSASTSVAGGVYPSANTYARDMTIYLSVGRGVYGYDLRNATAPIVRSHDVDLSNTLQSEDEVNQVAFSKAGGPGSGKIRLAAADDLGDVRVVENVPFKLSSDSNKKKKERTQHRCRVLQHSFDDENAMATCLAFHPRSGGMDLISGGTDCAIRLWDLSRPHRPSSSVQISGNDSANAQVCNPPFVNQIAFSKHGTLLAAALGDGTASILGIKGRSLSQKCRLLGGHSSSVASVLFPSFGSDSSSNISANDRLLVTGGSDGKIMLWDLGSAVAGKNAVDPSTWLVGCEPSPADDIAEGISSLSLDERNKRAAIQAVDPCLLFGIPHGEKINTIASSTSRECVLPSSLFVADTSNDITAYMVARN